MLGHHALSEAPISALADASPVVGIPLPRIRKGLVGVWGRSKTLRVSTIAPFSASEQTDKTLTAPWGTTTLLDVPKQSRWDPAAVADRQTSAPWTAYTSHVDPLKRGRWARSAARDQATACPWGGPMPAVDRAQRGAWPRSRASDLARAIPWGGPMVMVDRSHRGRFPASMAADLTRRVPWTKYSQQLGPTWGIVIPVHPPGEPPESLYIIPVQRCYVQFNEVELRRVDGDVALKAYSFSMSIDADSWTWSWSATLRKDMLDAVLAEGDELIELEATVNGVAYRLLVGSVGRDRKFPSTRIQVSGKGLAAFLGGEEAPKMTFGVPAARTANQLMEDVLTLNGAALDWTIDFGLTDWLVPAGAWSLQGTYMDALVDIATAAGGYVQPHATDKTLRVLHRYPLAPWDWGDVEPDFELPDGFVQVERTDWVKKPAYNRVFVGGVSKGVFGPTTRALSAGDVLAPQVLHPLITQAPAHLQRGRAVLSDTGRQKHLRLNMQVATVGGLIVPGSFVRYTTEGVDHIGIARNLAVDWSMPGLRQTVGIETHAA